MIGWERPQLDELGCSNGTFVYGYRVGKTHRLISQDFLPVYVIFLVLVVFQVYVDGDFHKSVMSSACTKVSMATVYSISSCCSWLYIKL